MKLDFILPDFNQFPSTSFNEVLAKTSDIFRIIGTGKESGKEYDAVKQRLMVFIEDKKTNFKIAKSDDVHRVFSVLIQETAPDNILEMLLHTQKFHHLLSSLVPYINDDNKELVCKKVLILYYSRYHAFSNESKSILKDFTTLLQELMQKYEGKNRTVLQAKPKLKKILQGVKYILGSYPSGTDIKVIYNDLYFLPHFEIWEALQMAYFIERVKKWKPNQYDDEVRSTLQEIIMYKDKSIGGPRSLLEEVAYIMLSKCKEINNLSDNWLECFREHIGDPRLARCEHAWIRIDYELYRWVRGLLSQQDVREFLTIMTDNNNDEVYQYRQQFWLQYVNKVQYAKVMLGKHTQWLLRRTQPELAKRIKENPEIYSTLEDNERSCIYMDFGNFCVIEGTHNAMVRFYNEQPINLRAHSYPYQSFYLSPKARQALEYEQVHQNSESYFWQNKLRNYIHEEYDIHVPIEQIFLQDTTNLRHDYIKKNLYSKGQSID